MSEQKVDAPDLKRVANGRPGRAGKTWTGTDQRRLAGMVRSGMTPEAMADALERLPGEIKRQLAASARRKRSKQPRA